MNLNAQQNLESEKAASRMGELSALRTLLAFTLLELLVVIAIIGILAAVGLPAIRGMSKSNSMTAANRQLLDDLAFARRRAISDHTTVYVVFIPPTIVNYSFPKYNANELNIVSNLWGGQFTTYAMLSLRSVGDQPGRPTAHYLTGWRTLPGGVFIATNKFATYDPTVVNEYVRAFPTYPNNGPNAVFFPFPLVTSNSVSVGSLPYIGFDYLGRLVSTNNENEAIPLARGSVFYQRDANGGLQALAADPLETPASNSVTISNVIHIDWLTGKARVERQEVQ